MLWSPGCEAMVLCALLSPSDTSPLCFPVYQSFPSGCGGLCSPKLFCCTRKAEGESENLLWEVNVCLFLFTYLYISKTYALSVEYLKVNGWRGEKAAPLALIRLC